MKAKTALLIQLDGKLPSVALMRLAAHRKRLGERVVFLSLPGPGAFERRWWDEPDPDVVFASLIFTDETAEAVCSLDYRDDSFEHRRFYCAWDNKGDEDRLFAGLERLVRYGMKPDEVIVYMLVGFWPGETERDRLYRHDKLRDFGCRPFPMPYRGTTGKPDLEVMWTRPLAEKVIARFPLATIGGTGWDLGKPPEERATLEKLGVGLEQDYSLYPSFTASIGYTMRGCRMTKKTCAFCDVPQAEGRPRAEQDLATLYRGEPWPRNLLILDNDFGGGPRWRELARAMREGGYRVCFSQGMNARLLTGFARWAIRRLDMSVSWEDWKRARFQTRNLPKRDGQRAMFGVPA